MPTALAAIGARKISTKLIVTQVVFLLVALSSIGLTLFVSWNLEGSAAALNDAGSLRMRAWRLAYLASQEAPLAAPRDGSEIERSIGDFDSVFETLRRGDPSRPLFLPRSDRVASRLEALDRHWQPLSAALHRAATGGTPPDRAEVERFVRVANELVVAIEEGIARTTEVLRYAQLALVALAIAGTVALMYLSFLVVIRPLTRLHEGIERMAAGDLSARVVVESRDEFGQVTEGFNAMADRLQGAYRSLENRVEQKTRKLAERSSRLQTLYEMAAFLNLPQSRSQMCEGFISRAQQSFGAAGGAVRLTAPDGNLHLYTTRELPAAMVEAEQCIPMGACTCGAAAERDRTIVRLIDSRVRPPVTGFTHCRDAGFAGVAATPIEAHGEVIGVFTLFFREPREFGSDDRHLLETLGQHLGVALEADRVGAIEKEMAISEERNLLAQELHDSIAQSLAFLNLQVQMLGSAMNAGDAARSATTLDEIRTGVQECYGDVRELLNHFRTRLAPADLKQALAAMAATFERRTGIRTRLVATGSGMPLAPDRQLQALHVVQEALSNARKHSACTRVDITLSIDGDYRIHVRDDGRGFDPAFADALEDHVGLRIMRERAARAGGHVVVDSRPGAGTSVHLTIPAAERQAA